MEDKIQEILLEQLQLLAKENKSEMIEPEQIVKNVLAMVEIAKLFNLYQGSQEFDELL